MYNLLTIIFGIGAIQSILFALLIIAKKKKVVSDKVLFVWFLTFFIHLLLGAYNQVYEVNTADILIMTISFLHGPFFLIYTKAIFSRRFFRFDFLHFLPFLGFTICCFYVEDIHETWWEIIVLVPKLISLVVYPSYILYQCNRRLLFLKSKTADNRLIIELYWLKVIAALFLISVGISLLRLSTELLVGVSYFKFLDVLRYVIFVTVIGFYGLKYGVMYTPELPFDLPAQKKRYKNSPLKNDEIRVIVDRINQSFQESEAYLRSDFSLAMLSQSIEVPKHHLSQIINSEMNTTFYDLVNSKRVAYAQHRIAEANNNLKITFEGLGYECGFNSKSAFFHHFKKHVGKTPGQFKKEISAD